MTLNKSFLMGLGIGVALTLVGLDMWGRSLDRKILVGANPWLLQPLQRSEVPEMPKSSERLPRPWLPTAQSTAHDHWSIRRLDGKPATLAEFKGKVVFLNFWLTSCAPCIAEMPGIEALHESLKTEPVAFLAVTREDERTVRSFLRKVPLRLPVYLGDKDAPQDLAAVGVPTTFILDRSGRVVYRHVGAENWDDDNARGFIRNLERQ